MIENKRIAVVIPCFRVADQIVKVLERIPKDVDAIYVVDDCCDQKSGQLVEDNFLDKSIVVIYHEVNQGVGGAVITGYKQAIKDGMDIVVKIDGDNQMDPSLISKFVAPIAKGEADYTKGNRFFNFTDASGMPKIRLVGNIALSFLTKASSGYWKIFDPTNGYTAISTVLLRIMPLEKISKRYFFESDILFRLSIANAKVVDISMKAVYEDEESNLHVRKILLPFLKGNIKNFLKRIMYKYFLQDFNMASLELCFGIMLMLFGVIFGGINWFENSMDRVETPVGTVIISALGIIVGFQLFLSFLSYDVSSFPKKAQWPNLEDEK
jgi:dolichol-phosphate mannosyltransferase